MPGLGHSKAGLEVVEKTKGALPLAQLDEIWDKLITLFVYVANTDIPAHHMAANSERLEDSDL